MKIKLCAIFFILILMLPLMARRNIMMTGYWAPTSEMIYQFSNDPELNPDGWIGENWENSGYDVYAFFPAFNRLTRDFEVDYQDTWEDFWAAVDEYNPIAIISYGAGSGPWEIECNARNLSYWVNDYVYPYQPTPCPPDSSQAANFVRHASLPVDDIQAAVNEQTQLNAWVDYNGNPGMFLCEYMAYLGMWYQDMHEDPSDPYPCLASGFIHVNAGVNLGYATEAAQVTLRTTIQYLHQFIDLEGTVIAEGINTAGTGITLLAQDNTEYSATADDNGSFSIPMLPAGTYTVTACLDRYYFFQEDILIDQDNQELVIELLNYPQLEPLSWCTAPTQIASMAQNIDLMIASAFSPLDLQPYADCHLRELIITSAIDPDEGTMEMILYQGTPADEENMEILWEEEITDFSAGQQTTLWLDEIIINPQLWENGLTIACQINSSTGDIAWMDEQANDNLQGNLINISGQWMNAPALLETDGDWDIRLGFYGTQITDENNDLIAASSRLANYPNPFNPSTSFSFYAPQSSQALLQIYNIKGQLIKNIQMQPLQNGTFTCCWQGLDNNGHSAASGIYFARASSSSLSATSKILLIK